jgi:hypothetical protein
MKLRTIFLLSFTLIIAVNYLSAQDNASRKVLLSLQPGESIITNESCLLLSSSANQLYLVTLLDKQIFVYENSQRSGPYKSFNDIKVRNCMGHNNTECAVYVQPEQNQTQEYIGFTDEGAYVIKFNAKTFGPYKFVSNLYVSPDKTFFVAIVANEMMKFSLVTSGGIQQNLDGSVERLIISPSGKQYLLLVKENASEMSMMNMDLSNMSQEALMKMIQEQAEKQKNAGPPQTQIIGTDGKLIGKYKSDQLYQNNPAYSQSGGDTWYMVIDNGLYVNGQLIKQFDEYSNVSTCKLWLSKDGKRFALVGYDKIIFSDGKTYPPAIDFQVDNSGPKTILKWISLENEKDIVSYSKEL